MAWQTPKTDWTSANGVDETDMNRIEENTVYLEAQLTTINNTIATGKSQIATALTNQGVPTLSTATFTTMATNVNTVATNKYNDGWAAGYAYKQPIYVGQLAGSVNLSTHHVDVNSGTVSATGITGYGSLTADNFLLVIQWSQAFNRGVDTGGIQNVGTTPAKSYNASTGVLTVTGLASGNVGYTYNTVAYCSVLIYCIK